MEAFLVRGRDRRSGTTARTPVEAAEDEELAVANGRPGELIEV